MENAATNKSTILYRGYVLRRQLSGIQWQVDIFWADQKLPVMPVERQKVRGWDEEEVLSRAKGRVDEVIDRHGPAHIRTKV
jgi:hypothetical protein